MEANLPYVTTGTLARKFGVPQYVVRRCTDKVCPSLPRHGLYRVIPPGAVEEIERLIRAHIERNRPK